MIRVAALATKVELVIGLPLWDLRFMVANFGDTILDRLSNRAEASKRFVHLRMPKYSSM
jgi:hypothetical protein